MPVVTIEMWPMKPDQKPGLIRNVTDVFVGMGIPAEAVTVVIHETVHDNWGSAGEQHSVKFRDIIKGMGKDTD